MEIELRRFFLMSKKSKLMEKYDIHEDFTDLMMQKTSINQFRLPSINRTLKENFELEPVIEGVTEAKETIKSYDGASLDVLIYRPDNQSSVLPALVYYHGGGFVLHAGPAHKWLACEYAARAQCVVIFVDYRLAPKAPFPIGLEDCYATYLWVLDQADNLKIDKSKIAVGGDSCGGNLANGVSMLARDRNVPTPCFQMLIYPITDMRGTTPSMKIYTDIPLWNSKINTKMWKLYLKKGFPIKREYTSPLEAESFSGLPPTFIEAAEHDCLRDEAIDYAKALKESGIPVTLEVVERVIHGFEIEQKSKVVDRQVDIRAGHLKTAFTS